MTDERIRLIVADIDGCFTGGGRAPLNTRLLAAVQEYNERSAEEPNIPHLVFNTGRPLPYIQAMAQAVHSLQPSIAEFGAVLWDPCRQVHYVHPEYSEDDHRRYEELVNEAEEEFSRVESEVLIEAGKLCQLTLYPRHPATIEDVVERAGPFTLKWGDSFIIDKTSHVLNFLPKGVHKGTALDWLSQYSEMPTRQMAGIGDSDCDWRFMERCGLSAAPKNAGPELKAKCDIAFDCGPEECILRLYDEVIAHNERLTV